RGRHMVTTTVTGMTAAKMLTIQDMSVNTGHVNGAGHLILTQYGGATIDAGLVKGAQGDIGPTGSGFVICTSSTRPAVTAGDEGLAIYETDTDLVRIWDGTRWAPPPYVICTATTRPSVASAAEGVTIYETDTNRRYMWSGTRWIPLGPLVCTSTSRPTDLTTAEEGFKIYENDTKLDYTWTGSAWTKPWGFPWGQLKYIQKVANSTPIAGPGLVP